MIELDEITIENILVEELQIYYEVLNGVHEDWYATDKDKAKDESCRQAIITVLSHYMTKEDHTEWLTHTAAKTQR
tara:strand:+ start:326 stop:550 length:225 start_codon:yes stop_codon:yes gene_type:complete